jgi:hypothetical protein
MPGRKMQKYSFSLFLLFVLFFTSLQFAQGKLVRENTINVYIDCNHCDQNYAKDNIQFVNFVRDRKVADVHVLFSRNKTGGGGRQYTLKFIGLGKFNGINDTLTYVEDVSDTDESSRIKMVKTLKLGLIKFINKSPIADKIEITYKREETGSEVKEEDPWNFWVFRLSTRSFINGEENASFLNLNYSLTASRITEDWKFQFSARGFYRDSQFDYDSFQLRTITRSIHSFNSAIMAIDEHWSAGVWLFLQNSTYNNIDFKASLAPGIEYNIFPYSDFNSKQLRINYRLWNKYQNYTEETIYFKTEEILFEQTISATLDLIQTWGSISTTIAFSNHLHDFSKNNLQFQGEVALQLFKGFTLNFDGFYSAIHDQLFLPKSDASFEDILLRQKQLATGYEYFLSFGISYTFGSIYNNLVNPRFGD